MSRYYLFDLPENLVNALTPFKLNTFVNDEEEVIEASSSSSESEDGAQSKSESEEDEDEVQQEDRKVQIRPTNLSYTQYNDEEDEESMEQWQWAHRAHITGTPYVYYANKEKTEADQNLLPDDKVLAIYKSWFTKEGLINSPVEQIKQLPKDGKSCILMVNSGNFAGAIIEHKRSKHKSHSSNPAANIIILESKTFHRYTTRRKQGGSQSASDAARGKANSAGSTIRRANERALQEEIRELSQSWAGHLQDCHRIFFKAPGRSNKQLIAGYPGAPIAADDERLAQIPFATSKPTLVECKQAWLHLTQALVTDPPKPPELSSKRLEKASKASAENSQKSKSRSPEPVVKSEEEIISAKIVDLVKRSKSPASKALLQKDNTDSWDFRLQPETQFRNSPTALFLAASLDKPTVVSQLLQWGANPELKNDLGQALGDVAKPNSKSYQALQISRKALGEQRWDWKNAKVGPGMTRDEIVAKEMAEKLKSRKEQQEMEAEQERQEHEQRMERLIKKHGSGKLVGGLYEASRGLSEADLRQVERERRARAAEARFSRLSGKN